MTTTSIAIKTTPERASRIVALLETVFENEGYPIDEVLLDEGRMRSVEILFRDKTPEEGKAAVRAALDPDLASGLVASRLGDEDWVAKSLEGLKPVWAARIVVHGSHDRDAIPAGSLAIEIEAAMAFGTGHHGSTVGCLLALQRVVRRARPRKQLDLGTGTGVLAIALAKLTRQRVVATDIDPVATRTARDNTILNEVGPLIVCHTMTGVNATILGKEGPFDLIVANILARPLQAMAGDINAVANVRATLVLSGLRPQDRQRILTTYRRHGFVLERADTVAEWMTLTLTRQPIRGSCGMKPRRFRTRHRGCPRR